MSYLLLIIIKIVNCSCLACSDEMCPIDILNTWLKNRLPSKDMQSECKSRTPPQSSAQSEYNTKYRLYFILISISFFMVNPLNFICQ